MTLERAFTMLQGERGDMNEQQLLDTIKYELVNWTDHSEDAAPALLHALRERGYDVHRPDDRPTAEQIVHLALWEASQGNPVKASTVVDMLKSCGSSCG